MQNNLNIRGEPIQSVFASYLQEELIVNRRYQRKLVWTLEEKESFIDSIIKQYPVPLFLGVSVERKGKKVFEILDGMQRLNAITSFLEGEYPVNNKYFDLSTISETNNLLKEGKVVQKEPKFSSLECSKILNYPLPISTSYTDDFFEIDETFRRINTGGHQLSNQEVRQAGILDDFSEIVRKIAITIRGDSSKYNTLPLNDMKQISITNKGLNYGLKLHEIFWIKEHIITYDNIRKSNDEELIAYLLSYIINPKESLPFASYLDNCYEIGSKDNKLMNNGVNKIGFDNLYQQFIHVLSEIKSTFHNKNFTDVIYKKNGTFKGSRVFQIIFLAYYDLLILKNRKIKNYDKLSKALNNIAEDHLIKVKDYWRSQDRSKYIQAISAILDDSFIPLEKNDPTLDSWSTQLETLLMQSKTEQASYDFKLGFCNLYNEKCSIEKKVISKVIKTLCAMNNTNLGASYVIIGIADNDQSAEKFSKKFNSKPIKFSGYNICGIDNEAELSFDNLDKYETRITQYINEEPIDENVKDIILSNFISINYYEKTLLVFKVLRDKKPYYYNQKLFIRNKSDVDEVQLKDQFDFFEMFKHANEQNNKYPY